MTHVWPATSRCNKVLSKHKQCSAFRLPVAAYVTCSHDCMAHDSLKYLYLAFWAEPYIFALNVFLFALVPLLPYKFPPYPAWATAVVSKLVTIAEPSAMQMEGRQACRCLHFYWCLLLGVACSLRSSESAGCAVTSLYNVLVCSMSVNSPTWS